MLSDILLQQARDRASHKRKKKNEFFMPIQIPNKGKVGGSYERAFGFGRPPEDLLSKILQQREEDLRKLEGERETTTTTTTKTKNEISSNKFIKIMQETKANFESGDWDKITSKSLAEALNSLKKEFQDIPEEELIKWGNFVYSFVNVTRPDFVIQGASTTANFAFSRLLQKLSESQKNALWRLLSAITIILGNGRNMQESDVRFVLENTNLNVDNPKALFESLSQSLEVFLQRMTCWRY